MMIMLALKKIITIDSESYEKKSIFNLFSLRVKYKIQHSDKNEFNKFTAIKKRSLIMHDNFLLNNSLLIIT